MRPETTTMSGNSGGTSSRPSGTRSNACGRSVRQAEYAVHRETVRERLNAIEASAPENGGRLEKTEDMLGHLENVLDDNQVKHGPDEPSGNQGKHNCAASARGSKSDKLGLKDKITA